MGMESYFVRLRPKEDEHFPTNKADLIQKFIEAGLYVKMKKRDYLLEELFIMRIEENSESIGEITIEGCFSWFEKGLEQCFTKIQVINDQVGSIQPLKPDNTALQLSKDECILQIKQFYHDNYKHFLLRYGNVEIRSLPGKAFYDLRKIKSFFIRLFGST
ncbi:hypothetical protein [Paenibacillus eucommiae]|uniref:Uncharacterized protein n=1 Tax=Paenibacillus eucommiae TaxID=1355755 RepID=A0ABS4IZB1_9BACL|nr:hypothetical protein [Paenibacillus eucommiae]MBP1992933.1 hypothetical protein [Paenibacillus eucommiae]